MGTLWVDLRLLRIYCIWDSRCTIRIHWWKKQVTSQCIPTIPPVGQHLCRVSHSWHIWSCLFFFPVFPPRLHLVLWQEYHHHLSIVFHKLVLQRSICNMLIKKHHKPVTLTTNVKQQTKVVQLNESRNWCLSLLLYDLVYGWPQSNHHK